MPRRGQKFGGAPVRSRQNPAQDWQLWMRPGSLCQARLELVKTYDDTESGFPRVEPNMVGIYPTVVPKGELVIYFGELRRRHKKDFNGKPTTEVTHHFLTSHGFVIADPNSFSDPLDVPGENDS